MAIRYYDMVIVSDDIAERYADCIKSLAQLDTKTARLHELKNWTINDQPVFAAGKGVDDGSDGGKGRLLFTYVKLNGQTGLCCYQELANHEYDRAQKSQGSSQKTIDSLLKDKKVVSVISGALQELTESAPASSIEDTAVAQNETQHIIYYRDHFICLDEAQQQVLFTTEHWPLVMSGPPGSGKSCVAIALLNAWTNQAKHYGLLMGTKPVSASSSESLPASSQEPITTGAPRFAYSAESTPLRRRMQEIWLSQPGMSPILSDSVHFTNYKDILRIADPEGTHEKTFLTREESRTRFKKDIKSFIKCFPVEAKTKGKGKAKPAKSSHEQDAALHEALYQECLTIAGIDSLETYLALGPRVSQFNEADDRDQKNLRTKLFHAFKRYQERLKADGLIDPLFYRPGCVLPKLFSGIAVDEAQDYAPVQTWVLKQVAEDGRIAYGVDTHQNIGEGAFNSIRAYLEHNLKANNIAFNYPYRCPNQVIDMANVALDLKLNIAGGLADKNDYPKIVRTETARAACRSGQVSYTADLPAGEALDALKQQIKGKATLAIVTRSELVAQLRKELGHPLIFSPQQIKGLEFEEIIVWDMFSDKRYYAANKYLVEADQNSSAPKKVVQHRNKQKTANLALKDSVTAMNELFTTLTRSTHRLDIYQKDNAHQLGYIVQPFKEMAQTFAATSATEAGVSGPSTDAEWMNQVNALIQQEQTELTERAFSIWVDLLGHPPEAFEAHCRQLLGLPAIEKIIAASSSSSMPAQKAKTSLQPSSSTAISTKPESQSKNIKTKDPRGPSRQKTTSCVIKQTPVQAALVTASAMKKPLLLPRAPKALKAAVVTYKFQTAKKLLSRPGTTANMIVDDDHETLLMFAIRYLINNDNRIVNLLLEMGANANPQDKKGATALMLAGVHANVDTLKQLIKYGADVNFTSTNMTSQLATLFSSAGPQQMKNIKFLMDKGADIDAAIEVLKINNPLASQFLIEYKNSGIWDPSKIEGSNQDDVIGTIFRGDLPKLGRLIEKEGANLTVANNCPALAFCAGLGQPLIVEFFLKQSGINTEARDNYGNTALILASGGTSVAEKGQVTEDKLYPCVFHLLQSGANVNAINHKGETALAIADKLQFKEISKLLCKFSVGLELRANLLRKAKEEQRGKVMDNTMMASAQPQTPELIKMHSESQPAASSSMITPDELLGLFGLSNTQGASSGITELGFFSPNSQARLPTRSLSPPMPPTSSILVDLPLSIPGPSVNLSTAAESSTSDASISNEEQTNEYPIKPLTGQR